jgi:hypothetical protein
LTPKRHFPYKNPRLASYKTCKRLVEVFSQSCYSMEEVGLIGSSDFTATGCFCLFFGIHNFWWNVHF